ncbi:hypothetical protein STRTUCAR8_09318 [Streptomyces turgidiscabies Car8]|uniref:Uncharacterized protein n=1 Tax=Streptomyces turgidiscabies (strain Car8) TaxID=698760 RepID=L7F8I4_STRT8|nr:hypothetical protein STRTUCAR8_09318 [Streptomyces turgidiscabies Car8]
MQLHPGCGLHTHAVTVRPQATLRSTKASGTGDGPRAVARRVGRWPCVRNPVLVRYGEPLRL